MPLLRGFNYHLSIRSFSCVEQTSRNRRFRIPMPRVASMAEGTQTFATLYVLKKLHVF